MQILTRPQVFGASFLSLLLLASVATWATDLPNRLAPVQRALAWFASSVAAFIGSDNRVYGDKIHVHGMTIDINHECTGIYVLLILATFLLAYPARWTQRIAGLAVGVAALTLLNGLRIAALVLVAESRPDLFLYFHEYVWQGIFLVLVILYAMRWVEHVR